MLYYNLLYIIAEYIEDIDDKLKLIFAANNNKLLNKFMNELWICNSFFSNDFHLTFTEEYSIDTYLIEKTPIEMDSLNIFNNRKIYDFIDCKKGFKFTVFSKTKEEAIWKLFNKNDNFFYIFDRIYAFKYKFNHSKEEVDKFDVEQIFENIKSSNDYLTHEKNLELLCMKEYNITKLNIDEKILLEYEKYYEFDSTDGCIKLKPNISIDKINIEKRKNFNKFRKYIIKNNKKEDIINMIDKQTLFTKIFN